jgi:tetratricopeptide (TPR) repeat protein
LSLRSYFPEQIGLLKNFFISELHCVRIVRLDPEMRAIFMRLLARLDDDLDFPHLFVLESRSFTDADSFAGHLIEALRAGLADAKPVIDDGSFRRAIASARAESEDLMGQLVRAASATADGMPDHVGSLVFVIDPDDVQDHALFRRAVVRLAQQTDSRWLKYVILEERGAPALADLEQQVDRIGAQSFHLAPAEIESRLRKDLDTPGALSAPEQRQYLALLASFAFASKRYEEAEAMQRTHMAQCEAKGTPQELASACQSLGGTLFARGEFAAATGAFCRACDLAVEHKIDGLAPFAYTNLGLSLHRVGDLESAIASLRVARDTFRAMNHRPGEAYVVDCLGQIHLERGERAEAERAWRYALTLYDGITTAAFGELRKTGGAEIRAKLERLGARANATLGGL